MHMSDALISPVVGGVMYAAAVGTAVYSVKHRSRELMENRLPLMGVAGAFVFAAQMINFAIPGTGSSGHIGGGLLLSALLGGGPAYLVMGAVLLIQALFFADGGLLAFGCNWFNMAFFSCVLAYPLVFKRIVRVGKHRHAAIMGASVAASIIGLQMGAFSVVMETVLSGKTALPFGTFLLFMQPIHLAIGIGEGIITGAVLSAIYAARPEMTDFSESAAPAKSGRVSRRAVVVGLACAALVVGVVVSSFASAYPDGLEWSIEKTTPEEISSDSPAHGFFASIQEKLAFLPDYSFKSADEASAGAVDPGTAVSGAAGAAITLGTVIIIGFIVKSIRKKNRRNA